MIYKIITNNDGELNERSVNSKKNMKAICQDEYVKLINIYKEDCDEFELTDRWENAEVDSYSMGATIDYAMGHEYIYDISVKVEVA